MAWFTTLITPQRRTQCRRPSRTHWSWSSVKVNAWQFSLVSRQDIKVGYALLSVNGETVTGKVLPDGRRIVDFLSEESNFPVTLGFARPKVSANERIMLASMFHSLWAIASKLSPEKSSSGIEVLEAESFQLHCLHTLTGLKFLVMADPRQSGVDALLRKIYEVYADYTMKNPFYSLEMPIRCELFDVHLAKAVEQADRASMYAASLAMGWHRTPPRSHTLSRSHNRFSFTFMSTAQFLFVLV